MELETIWAEYQQALKGFLLSKISDHDEVEDILQEVLIKTHENLPSIRDTSRIKSWLFQVANRTAMDYYRSKSKSDKIEEKDLWFATETQSIQKEFSTCITPFISALPQEYADILLAIELHGESQKEYAEKLGISYSTFKSRVQKSRQMLRKIFDDCCHYSVDRKGNLIDYVPKNGQCNHC